MLAGSALVFINGHSVNSCDETVSFNWRSDRPSDTVATFGYYNEYPRRSEAVFSAPTGRPSPGDDDRMAELRFDKVRKVFGENVVAIKTDDGVRTGGNRRVEIDVAN